MQSVTGSGPQDGRETEADRLVTSVFADVRGRLPFVPAYLKALEGQPRALLEAWVQTRSLHDDPRTGASIARLLEAADPTLSYVASDAVRDAVQPFHTALPGLLLAVASLRLTLDGALECLPLPATALPPGPIRPVPEVPDEGEDPSLFPDIRRVYGTEHVPSMYRSLAARGLLAEPWAVVGSYLDGIAGRERVNSLRALADVEAQRFPEWAFLGTEGARPVIDVFRQALPLNLVFAVACYRIESGSREDR